MPNRKSAIAECYKKRKKREREARDIRSCPPKAKLLIVKDFWQNRQQACSSNAAAGNCGYYQSLTGSRELELTLERFNPQGSVWRDQDSGEVLRSRKLSHTARPFFDFTFFRGEETSQPEKMAAGCGDVASRCLRGSQSAGPARGVQA